MSQEAKVGGREFCRAKEGKAVPILVEKSQSAIPPPAFLPIADFSEALPHFGDSTGAKRAIISTICLLTWIKGTYVNF